MGRDWARDVERMHDHYGFRDAMRSLPRERIIDFVRFRFRFLREELEEGEKALDAGLADEVVDALIDLCVVSIGTLDLLEIDAHEAWDRVDVANMSKEPGVKESRPNPFGFPDLTKPAGWIAPRHDDNTGLLSVHDVNPDQERIEQP